MKKSILISAFLISVYIIFINIGYSQEYPVSISEDGFIIVEVTLNDSINSNFILDTGAGAIVLSAKTFDKISKDAIRSGYFTGFRNDGDRLDGVIYKIPSLAIGNVVENDVMIGVYPPLDEYGVDGLVSLKFFENRPFTIDFKNEKIRFIENTGAIKNNLNSITIPVTLQTHTDFSLDIFFRVCLNNNLSVNAEFDTGSGFNAFLINPYFINELGLDKTKLPSSTYITPVSGTKLEEYKVILDTVSVCNADLDLTKSGKIFKSITSVFREGLIYEALIGSFLFKDSKVTIDIPNKEMIIEN